MWWTVSGRIAPTVLSPSISSSSLQTVWYRGREGGREGWREGGRREGRVEGSEEEEERRVGKERGWR